MIPIVQVSVARRADSARRWKGTVTRMKSAKDPLNVAGTTAMAHQAGHLALTAVTIQVRNFYCEKIASK